MSPVFNISRFRPAGITSCRLPDFDCVPYANLCAKASPENASELASTLRDILLVLKHNNFCFDLVFLCGGLSGLKGLREATADFPVPVHIALEPQFISLSAAPVLREQLRLGSPHPLWIVDIGQSHLKISLQSRHTTRCVFRRPSRLTTSCIDNKYALSPNDRADLTQESLDWLRECFAQVRVRTEPRCHLVVGLPCEIDDALTPAPCSYPGWDRKKAFGNEVVAAIGQAIFEQGSLVQNAAVLDNSELAACGALAQLSREGASYKNALILTLGIGPRAAILSRSVPRDSYPSD